MAQGGTKFQDTLDAKALETAVKSLTLIEAHIDECRDTRQRLMDRFDDLKADRKCDIDDRARVDEAIFKKIDQINNRGITVGGAIIGLLLAALGYFVVTDGLPGQHTSTSTSTTTHTTELK